MADSNKTKKNLSQQEQRDLDIEIDFLEGVLKRDRRYVEALQLLGDDYTRRGRFEDGLRVDRRLARLCPDDPLVYYNLACSFSLTAEYRKAANALRKAINAPISRRGSGRATCNAARACACSFARDRA